MKKMYVHTRVKRRRFFFAGSCAGVECGSGKTCVVRSGSPKCICSPNCKRHDGLHVKGPVCGTDGVSYKSHCRLKKRSCRTRDQSLVVAYHGLCQSECVHYKPSLYSQYCRLNKHLSVCRIDMFTTAFDVSLNLGSNNSECYGVGACNQNCKMAK